MNTSNVYMHRYGDPDAPVTMIGLHGWSGDHTTFAQIAPHLGPNDALLAVDMPGYGQSPDPPSWSMDVIAQILADAITEATEPGSPLTLVGTCSGAVVCLKLAPLLGDRLAHMVMVEPFAFMPWYFGIFLTPVLGRFFYWTAFENPIGKWITNQSLKDNRTDDSDLSASFDQTRSTTTLGYLRLMDQMGDAHTHAGITRAPITLLHGSKTFAAVHQSVDIWSEVWPWATRHLLEGGGHLLLEEVPQKAAPLLRRDGSGGDQDVVDTLAQRLTDPVQTGLDG